MKPKVTAKRKTLVSATPRRLALAYRSDSIDRPTLDSRRVHSATKILVPVDLTSSSRAQLRAAADIARKMGGAQIVLLHIFEGIDLVPPLSTSRQRQSLNALLHSAAREKLSRLKAEFTHDPDLSKAALIAIPGDPATQTLAMAASMEADLIVIFRHPGSRLRHLLLGSKAEHIIRHARCPVLIAPSLS